MSKLDLMDSEVEALRYAVDRAGGYLALSSAATKVLAFLDAQESNSNSSYLKCWAALDQIMVEAGMDKKLQPKEAQAWLRGRLRQSSNLQFLHDEYALLKAERDSETRWARDYKVDRDALQKAVDAFAVAYISGKPIGFELHELVKLANGAK